MSPASCPSFPSVPGVRTCEDVQGHCHSGTSLPCSLLRASSHGHGVDALFLASWPAHIIWGASSFQKPPAHVCWPHHSWFLLHFLKPALARSVCSCAGPHKSSLQHLALYAQLHPQVQAGEHPGRGQPWHAHLPAALGCGCSPCTHVNAEVTPVSKGERAPPVSVRTFLLQRLLAEGAASSRGSIYFIKVLRDACEICE